MLCITQAVLWTLWSRLVRLLSYLRQLLAETPAQKLHVCSAVKREDWSVVVACMDTEVRKRSIGSCKNERACVMGVVDFIRFQLLHAGGG